MRERAQQQEFQQLQNAERVPPVKIKDGGGRTNSKIYFFMNKNHRDRAIFFVVNT